MGNFLEIHSISQRRFLNAFAKSGRLLASFACIEMDPTNHYKWLKDPDYAKAFAEAEVMAGDVLENEAVRRAVEGVDKPVYQQGKQVGVIREYSDGLLQFLLRGNKPDKYRDRTDITTAGKELRITIGNGDAI